MQPAGRVRQNERYPACVGVLHRIENHGTRVASFVAPHEPGADPFGPQPQLVGRGGPERVPGRHDDLRALLLFLHGHLADRGRLAHAVDADEQPYRRLAVRRPSGSSRSPPAGRPAPPAARRPVARRWPGCRGEPHLSGPSASTSVVVMPTSARIRASSSSSHDSWSSFPRRRSPASWSASSDLARPSRSRNLGRLEYFRSLKPGLGQHLDFGRHLDFRRGLDFGHHLDFRRALDFRRSFGLRRSFGPNSEPLLRPPLLRWPPRLQPAARPRGEPSGGALRWSGGGGRTAQEGLSGPAAASSPPHPVPSCAESGPSTAPQTCRTQLAGRTRRKRR